MKKFIRDERGLTLMELVIVLAIIAVISAIITPNFLKSTEKAKLRSDILSASVLQNSIELYDAEHTVSFVSGRDAILDGSGALIETLVTQGYLSASAKIPQTEGLHWKYIAADKLVKADISGCDSEIKGIAVTLNDNEKFWLTGY